MADPSHPHRELVKKALAAVADVDSQREKARMIGVSQSTVKRWLEGDIGVPLRGPTLEPLKVFLGRYNSTGSVIRDGAAEYQVVPLDQSGAPLEGELEELRSWLPDEAVRRLSRHSTPRAWLGMLYAHGIDEGWPKERLDRIDSARRRVDELRQTEDPA